MQLARPDKHNTLLARIVHLKSWAFAGNGQFCVLYWPTEFDCDRRSRRMNYYPRAL